MSVTSKSIGIPDTARLSGIIFLRLTTINGVQIEIILDATSNHFI